MGGVELLVELALQLRKHFRRDGGFGHDIDGFTLHHLYPEPIDSQGGRASPALFKQATEGTELRKQDTEGVDGNAQAYPD